MNKPNTNVANATNTQVASATQFEEMAGAGFSEITAEDLAIPFLRILDSSSPQTKKREGAYVEGAEAGDFFNTVLSERYSGTDGIRVIPCHYNTRYVEWIPIAKGGGFVESYLPSDPIVETAVRDKDSSKDMLPNGNELTRTAQFYVIFLHPELGPQRALITMTSSQLKKARKWLSQSQSLTRKGKNGIYTMPLMSQIYKLTTVPESNEKGSWFGWEVVREREIDLSNSDENSIFKMAVEFANSAKAGEVEAKDVDFSKENDDSIM